MADSTIAITAGSGTAIDTRTEATNGNHRQVVVLGDPSTNAGVAPVDATAGLKVDLGADNDITGTVTANLSATDNAVLDAIAASTAAIETAVEGTLTVTGGGGGTEYTEDVATANPIVGTATLIERDDALSTVTPIEGDWIGLRGTAEGALWTQDFNSDGILADTTAIKTSLETAGGQLVNLGANNDVTVTGTVDLGATDNAVLDSIAAKDFATQTTLAAINAKLVTGTDIGDVTINNSTGAAAVNIQDGGNTITVDGTVAVTSSDITSIKTAVEILDNAIAGTEMQVDVVGALPAGTNAIGKLAANSGVDIGDVDVTSLPALAAGTNAVGKLLPPDVDVTTHTNYAKKYYTNAGAVTDGIIWSPAAGKRWHIVSMFINVSAAATVTLEDDKAGGDEVVWKMELAANSGVGINFSEKYPLASGEDAADLTITTSAGNVYVTCVGYEV